MQQGPASRVEPPWGCLVHAAEGSRPLQMDHRLRLGQSMHCIITIYGVKGHLEKSNRDRDVQEAAPINAAGTSFPRGAPVGLPRPRRRRVPTTADGTSPSTAPHDLKTSHVDFSI